MARSLRAVRRARPSTAGESEQEADLASVRVRQAELAARIAAFEAQASPAVGRQQMTTSSS